MTQEEFVNNVVKKNIKKRCIERIKFMKLGESVNISVLKDFKNKGILWKSESHIGLSKLNEYEQMLVRNFEDKYKDFGVMVYHCTKSTNDYGDNLFGLIYCSNNKNLDDLNFDKFKRVPIIALYEYNLTKPELSGFTDNATENGDGYINLL